MGASEKVTAGESKSSLWLASNPSKRWGELFFLFYTPFWLTLCLGIVVPYKLYEVLFYDFPLYVPQSKMLLLLLFSSELLDFMKRFRACNIWQLLFEPLNAEPARSESLRFNA
ncbi:putative cycloeucalenol cycloisomerase [Helianthus anomalus]